MSVKHRPIHHRISANEGDSEFIGEMNLVLRNVLERARSLGTTVDWGTLRIESTDEIETYTAAGEKQRYTLGLELWVDSIAIEEEDE